MKNVEIIDLFCGVGGLTCGLKRVGFNVLAGYDIDPACKFPYEYNNKSSFILQNVNKTTGKQLLDIYTDNSIKVLVGCAPCQPFSLLRKKMGDDKNENDEKFNLLLEFSRLIKECQPDVISMENVPQIQNTSVFKKFVKTLSDLNYFISYKVVFCPDYGIPQNRRRFLLLASKFGKIDFLPPTHNKRDIKISDFIMRLPKIKAGETCKIDNLHKSANLSALNLSRIKVSKPGGTWLDWPKNLRCKCHLKESGKSFTSPYSRMSWNKIAPTITTEFFSYGTGRFGHPEQNRALSLREGAILQTFPNDYKFINFTDHFSLQAIARQIGNAVPVKLGEVIGLSIVNHINKHEQRI